MGVKEEEKSVTKGMKEGVGGVVKDFNDVEDGGGRDSAYMEVLGKCRLMEERAWIKYDWRRMNGRSGDSMRGYGSGEEEDWEWRGSSEPEMAAKSSS